MALNITFDINLLRDYSSIFTRNEVFKWMKSDFRSLENLINRYSDKKSRNSFSTYFDFIKYSYAVIEKNYPNEYVYKNSFLNHWLISELGQTDSILFNEFRAGKSVCDLAMFNGISKAFEIKTEFDSDKRLKTQLLDYSGLFNETYLIVPSSKLSVYQKYDDLVGIIAYDHNFENKFELVRTAKYNSNLDNKLIMEILHSEEYKSIVQEYYGELPNMNGFNQYKVCGNLISEIPASRLNELFISHMKRRKFDKLFSNRYFKEINQICLALKFDKEQKQRLIENLKEPIR